MKYFVFVNINKYKNATEISKNCKVSYSYIVKVIPELIKDNLIEGNKIKRINQLKYTSKGLELFKKFDELNTLLISLHDGVKKEKEINENGNRTNKK